MKNSIYDDITMVLVMAASLLVLLGAAVMFGASTKCEALLKQSCGEYK